MGFWTRLLGRGRSAASPATPAPGTAHPQPHAASALSASDAGRQAFLHLSAQVLAAHGACEVTSLPDTLGLGFVLEGRRSRAHLETMYQETRELPPEEREARLRALVSGLTHRMESLDWDAARPLLVPVLRAPTYAFGPHASADHQPVSRLALPLLHECVVLDLPTTMAYVTLADAARWGVTAEALLAEAHANLPERATAHLTLYDRSPSPIWTLDAGGDYESSYLLHPGFLQELAGHVEGRPVVAVPERAQVYVTGDDSPAALERLCALAEREYAASPRSLSMALYTLDASGAVVPYRREGDDALARRVADAHVQFAGTEYTQQKEALEQSAEERDDVAFVASFSGVRATGEGRLVSYSTWAPGIETLLPETEYVTLPEPGKGPPRFVRLADALRVAPEALRAEPGMFPVRYRTQPGPLRASVLEALRTVAVESSAVG